jgi:hypothetical protein
MNTIPIRALVVEENGARFVEQELDLEEPGRGEAPAVHRYYGLGDVEQALADSKPGAVVEPILRMPG